MTNLYALTPNIVLGAKDDPQPIETVFASGTLISIVEVDNVGKQLFSYIPGRPLNTLSHIKKDKGYYVFVSQDLDKEEYFAPPQKGGGAYFVYAGEDQIINLPNSATLTADSNGTGMSWSWTKISAGNAVFSPNAQSKSVSVSGLSGGVHKFKVAGTDYKNATLEDEITVIANDPSGGAGGTQIIDNDLMWIFRSKFWSNNKWNYYEIAVPKYIPAGVKLPLNIMFHGAGEKGGEWNWGPGNLDEMLIGPVAGYARRRKGGYGFISVAIQISGYGSHDPVVIKHMIDILTGKDVPRSQSDYNENFGLKQYPIDENRISGTGLSEGGNGLYNFMYNYPEMFSAAAVFAGYIQGQGAMQTIKCPIRIYHNRADDRISADNADNAELFINSGNPPQPVVKRIWEGVPFHLAEKHDCWSRSYAGVYVNELFPQDVAEQIYDWLTSWRKTGTYTYVQDQTGASKPYTQGSVSATAEIAFGGTDEGNFNGHSALLNAIGYNADGTNADYAWEKMSGVGTLSNATGALIAINNPQAGAVIKLTVTRSDGQVRTATITT